VKAAGPHLVRVESPGLAPYVGDRIAAGKTARVELSSGGTIEGVVRNRSGAPVAGAVVQSRDSRSRDAGVVWDPAFGVVSATTDAQGRYRLAGIGAGAHTVTAALRGRGRAQRRAVTAGARADLVLLPASSVTGIVARPDDRPASGALVLLEPPPGVEPVTRVVVADAAGRFEFPGVEPGHWRVIARHEPLAPAWQAVPVRAAADAAVSLRLGDPVTLRGHLTDAQARPVQGRLDVTVIDEAAPPRALSAVLSTETADDGRFRLAALPSGLIGLTARAAGLAPRRVEVAAAAGARELDVGTVVLETGLTVRGFVRDPQGRPVAEARVTARGPEETGPTETLAARDGGFVLAGLPPGRVRVSAQAPGFAAVSRDVEPGGERIVLVLPQTGTVTGTVVDVTGSPVVGYRVIARPQPSHTRLEGAPARRDVQCDDGRFTVEDLVADTYVLSVVAPGREPAGLSNVVVRSGAVADVGEIRLATGGIVRGTVVDATGVPVAGATVRAAPPRRMMGTLGAGAETASDAAGTFELRGVPTGSARITAHHPEYAPGVAMVEVESTGGPADVQVVLRRGGRLEGHARHRDGSPVMGSVMVQPLGTGSLPLTAADLVPVAADGTFAVDHLPAGRVRIVLMSGRGRSGGPERQVEVEEGRTAAVAFDLREVLVTGRITRAGAPAPGLRVSLRDDRTLGIAPLPAGRPAPGGEGGAGLTREDGTYELLAAEPGRVLVTVEAADGSLRLPLRTAEIPDLARHTLDLDFAGVVLAGTVVDERTDRPVAHATVFAEAHEQHTDGRSVSAITNPDGRFQLDVAAGRYRVSVRADGYAAASADVEVQPAGVSDVRLPLPRGATVRGRVVDPSGRPAGDGLVRAIASTPGAGASSAPLLPDGRFEIGGLADGEYTLVARSDGGGFALRAGVTSGAEDVTLLLRRGGRIELKLVGTDGAPVPGASASVFRVDGVPSPGIVSSQSDAGGLATLSSPAGAVEVRAAKIDGPVMQAAGSVTVLVEEGSTATAEVVLASPGGLER
jgi:protocatechuate 3,4-dioxygenase beta subunit